MERSDADEVWERLRAFCLDLPGAWEDHPWGPDETVFKVGRKIFAMPASGPPVAVTAKATPEFRDMWQDHPATFVPAYVGRFGWLGVRIVDEEAWDMATAAVLQSYERVRPRRAARPPARTGGGLNQPSR
jgi:predicted DNA-binding protein (MmcQ/YjbR family)